MKDYYCVMTFHSTYHALNFEKVLIEKGYDVRLMPVPRQVSSSCGTAAEFPCSEREEIIKICMDMEIEIDQVHKIEERKSNSWRIKLLKR